MPTGLTIAEKFFGLMIILIGALTIYFTYTSLGDLGEFSRLFFVPGFALIVIGVLLLLAKAE